ncbi:MAG: hypothetical protein R3D67_01620 [Hyphomicrobiaceae bacterium]
MAPPEVKVGFSGGLISNLVTRIPHKVAMELLLIGEQTDAKRAYEVEATPTRSCRWSSHA